MSAATDATGLRFGPAGACRRVWLPAAPAPPPEPAPGPPRLTAGEIAELEGWTRPCSSCGRSIPWRRWRPRCLACHEDECLERARRMRDLWWRRRSAARVLLDSDGYFDGDSVAAELDGEAAA